MSLFSKVRDTYRIQKDAKRIKKELKSIHIEAEEESVLQVTVSAEQELVSVKYTENAISNLKNGSLSVEKLEELTVKTINRAMKKAQEIAGQKMKVVWDQMGSLK